MKIRTTALLIIVAVAAIITVAGLLAGLFSVQDSLSKQGLLASGVLILTIGGGLAFLAATIIARPFEALRQLKQAAEDASAAKSNFLTHTSHEMRTPLNAIIGLSELMLYGNSLPKEVADNLEKIYGSGMTLLSIVNDILDISRIESAKFELILSEYDVPSMINDIQSLNRLRIAEKPVSFQVMIDEAIPSKLVGDELRVKQIFNNLLSNACNYTDKGSIEWSINWERDADKVWLISSIKDTGSGIREEELGKLFSSYSGQNFKDKRKTHGSGLGLAITRRMVEAMNGSISVSSAYGKGTTFTVRIQQKYVPSPSIGVDIVKSLKNVDGKNYTTNKRLRAMKFTRIPMPYAKLLIVDDVPTNLDIAKGILKPYGMQVDCVTSGTEAIKRIRSETVIYNAIFMDHMMPEMDGIEATRIIREEIGSNYAMNIPIIALTANAIVGNEEKFLKKGFQAFLSKPVDVARMDAILRQWVRDKEQENKAGALPASMSASHAEARQKGEEGKAASIEGIDWQAGLDYFSGDRDVYLSVLRSYVDNTAHLINTISHVTAETLSDYAIHVHGIKGSSYAIEAREIAKQAEELEHAAKAGDLQIVNRNTPLFVENTRKLLNTLTGFLRANAPETEEKPIRHAPDETLLERMQSAAANFKIDEMEETLKSLECFEYETQAELVNWLHEKTSQMEYIAIQERLSKWKREALGETI
ncbi:MAG: response regulator [Azoarcus sp.]|nr:response regulator [Azoarcus sp.]